MFRYRRRRIIPIWYKLIEEKNIKNKYKKYIITFLILDLIICIPLIKESNDYKRNSSKIEKTTIAQVDNKFLELENKILNEDQFKQNLKEINLKENSLRLTLVFDSIEESNNLIKNLNKYNTDIKMTVKDDKYIYYISI